MHRDIVFWVVPHAAHVFGVFFFFVVFVFGFGFGFCCFFGFVFFFFFFAATSGCYKSRFGLAQTVKKRG